MARNEVIIDDEAPIGPAESLSSSPDTPLSLGAEGLANAAQETTMPLGPRPVTGIVSPTIRHGSYIIPAMVFKNPFAVAASAALGSHIADTIEDAAGPDAKRSRIDVLDRQFQKLTNAADIAKWSLLGSFATPFINVAARGVSAVGWSPIAWALRKAEVPQEVRSAGAALERVSTRQEPLTLSLGQMQLDFSRVQGIASLLGKGAYGTASFLENVVRSAAFGKRFGVLDRRNIDELTNLAFTDLQSQAKSTTRDVFAQDFANMVSGEKTFAAQTLNTLFDSVRALGVGPTPTPINTNGIRQWLIDRGVTAGGTTSGIGTAARSDIGDELARDVYNVLLRRGVLTRNNLRLDNPAGWDRMPVSDALEVRAGLNELINESAKDSEKRIFRQARDLFRDDLYASLNPTGQRLLQTADNFASMWGNKLDKAILQKFLNNLEPGRAPELSVDMLRSSKSRLTLFRQLRDFYTEQPVAGVPGPTTSLGLKRFEDDVVMPLRHSILCDSTLGSNTGGINAEVRTVNAAQLKKTLTKMGDDFLNEVFGKVETQNWRDLANALEIAEKGPGLGSKVFVQLIQGGSLAAVGVAAYQGDVSKVWERTKYAFLVNLTPYVLGRIVSNPARINMLTKGILSGPNTAPFNRALIQIAAENRESVNKILKWPAEKIAHFSTIDNKGFFTGGEQPPEPPMVP